MRYVLVSAIYAMVVSFGFPVLVFPFSAEILLYHAVYPSSSMVFLPSFVQVHILCIPW